MKKLFLLLLVLFATTMAKADDMVLQVLLSDGQVVSINLNEEPRTTYQNGNLVITSTKNTVTYPLEKVRRFTYVTATGIDSPKMLGASFSNDGETLTFKGLKPHTKIYLYNVAGQLLKTIDSGEQSQTVISASHMPFGVYVVKVNGGTFKITKR
jgi:hypothetical protein